MQVKELKLQGLKLILPDLYRDPRGFFFESYSHPKYESHGITSSFVQGNHTLSSKNTLRGLHFQQGPGQAKLVRVIEGSIFDVAVDIRPESKTFRQWEGIYLDDQDHHQLFIPEGFAHGFCVLTDRAQILYQVSRLYEQETESGFAWNDPSLAIQWPIKDPLLSERDKNAPLFSELFQAQGGAE